MKAQMLNPTGRLAAWLSGIALAMVVVSRAADPSPAWPRRGEAAPYKVALHEPAVESFDQEWIKARAAVTVTRNDGDPIFGAIWFGLRLSLNADKTLGRVTTFRLDQMRFPEGVVVERAAVDRALGNNLVNADLEMAPLLASFERERAAAEAAAAGSQAVPDILYTTVPVALVRLDGEAELKDIPDSDLLAVVNSNTPIFLQKGSTTWFMTVQGRWLSAPAVEGPWQDVQGVPESVRKAMGEAPGTPVPVQRPLIVVVTRATEVIAVDGEPRYSVIPGTDLLYVNNTDADLFLDIAGQKHYVLLAGRWFATANLEKGPWEVVPGDRLPQGFAAIPPGSPKYGVLAHVPGTGVAQEAVQDAAVPQAQKLTRGALNLTVEYEGDPEFVQAGQTTVYYAVNTPYSVVRVDPYYYLCHGGAWYYGAAAWGPWSVCVSVPGVIYTIPPACPVYPVTYVRVYDWTPDYVWFGFTSGYLGWYVGGSALVFGFAYYDDAWWHHHYPYHGHYYQDYHHDYHCGSYPHHGWHRAEAGYPGPHGWGRDREDWHDPKLAAGPAERAAGYARNRPGPEVHQFAGNQPRGGAGDGQPGRSFAAPNRYDGGPGSVVAGKVRGSSPAAMASAGRPERVFQRGNDPRGPDAGSRAAVRRERDAMDAPVDQNGKPPAGPGPDRAGTWNGGARADRGDRPAGVTPGPAEAGRTVTPKPVTPGPSRDADAGGGRGDRPAGVTPGPAEAGRTVTPKPVTPGPSRDVDAGGDRGDRPAAVTPTVGEDRPAEMAPAPKPAQVAPSRTQPEARPVNPTPAAPNRQPAPSGGKGTGGKVNSSYFEERYGTGLVQSGSPRPAPVVAADTAPQARSSGLIGPSRGRSSAAAAPRSAAAAAADASPMVRSAPAVERASVAPREVYETQTTPAPRVADSGTSTAGAVASGWTRGAPAAVDAGAAAAAGLGGAIANGAKAVGGAVGGAVTKGAGGGRTGKGR